MRLRPAPTKSFWLGEQCLATISAIGFRRNGSSATRTLKADRVTPVKILALKRALSAKCAVYRTPSSCSLHTDTCARLANRGAARPGFLKGSAAGTPAAQVVAGAAVASDPALRGPFPA